MKLCEAQSQSAVFNDFAESSLKFELLFWSKNRFRIEDVKSDIRFMINSEFAKNDVRIPFPQRDIHIKTETRVNASVEEPELPENDTFR